MNLNFFKKKEIKEKETERVEIIIRYSYEWNDDVPNEEMDTPAHPSLGIVMNGMTMSPMKKWTLLHILHGLFAKN